MNGYEKDDDKQLYNRYLKLSIELAQKYDIYDALEKNSIVPGYSYKISDINHVLKRRYKKNAFMPICELKDYKVYLREIRICLDSNFYITNCLEHDVQFNIYKCSKRFRVQFSDFPDPKLTQAF